MINTYFLERQIDDCDWSDLVWFNGLSNPGTPEYSTEEIKQLKARKKELQKQLDNIESAL